MNTTSNMQLVHQVVALQHTIQTFQDITIFSASCDLPFPTVQYFLFLMASFVLSYEKLKSNTKKTTVIIQCS